MRWLPQSFLLLFFNSLDDDHTTTQNRVSISREWRNQMAPCLIKMWLHSVHDYQGQLSRLCTWNGDASTWCHASVVWFRLDWVDYFLSGFYIYKYINVRWAPPCTLHTYYLVAALHQLAVNIAFCRLQHLCVLGLLVALCFVWYPKQKLRPLGPAVKTVGYFNRCKLFLIIL